MTKEKMIGILTTVAVVFVSVLLINSLTTWREVDAAGKVVPDGKAYKPKLGFRRR